MAIQHRASHGTHRRTNGLTLFLVALSVVCGLFSFVLCLVAEGSRTEATWYTMTNEVKGSDASRCIYNASGRRPLACAVGAFLLLVGAMFAIHAYMLVVFTSRPTQTLVAGTAGGAGAQVQPSTIRTLQKEAPLLLLTTWICFAIAEVLLMIGMAVESSHICQESKPRSTCHVVRPGLFAVAGVFGLLTVLLGSVPYAMETKATPAAGPAPQPSAPPQP